VSAGNQDDSCTSELNDFSFALDRLVIESLLGTDVALEAEVLLPLLMDGLLSS